MIQRATYDLLRIALRLATQLWPLWLFWFVWSLFDCRRLLQRSPHFWQTRRPTLTND
jgi:hypothetical protein